MYFSKTCVLSLLFSSAILASASVSVTVTSPGSGASLGSPVNYVASASTTCAGGISAIAIYTAPGVKAYTIHSNKLNTNINLKLGSYSTVVQAFDKCGGSGKKTVSVSISKINLPPPNFLYATEYTAGKIAGYRVDPLTGSLTPTSQGSAWAHFGPVDLAANKSATHLYATNHGSQDMDAYFINRTTGALTQVPGSPYKLNGVGHRVVVHPSEMFVYATSTISKNGIVQSTDINAFAVQSDASLKPVPGSPFSITNSLGGAPPSLAMDAKGQYLYTSASTSNGGAVQAFTINGTDGSLTPVPGSPFIVPVGACTPGKAFCQETPTDLVVHPSGNYLYAVLGIESAIAGFGIDRTTGVLSDLAGSPYPEINTTYGPFCPYNAFGTCPFSWTASMDPSGKFIYVSDMDFNEFSIFKLNQNTGVPGSISTTLTSQSDLCVPDTEKVDPSGTFLYTLGFSGNQCALNTHAVVGFSFNRGTGQLNSVPGSPFANPSVNTGNTSEDKVLVTP